jgi:D-3-phosphoglycerate dehydrogenase
MKKVLNCIFHYDEAATALLKNQGYEIIQNQRPRTLTFAEIADVIAEVDAIIAGSGEPLDENIFKLAKKLKIIARWGVGYENVDVAKAGEYGIKVTNTKVFEVANGVAEFTAGLILDGLRRISQMDQDLKAGKWNRFVGRQLRGTTVGILGFGAIGKRLAQIISGFDVNILAFDKYPDEKAAKELRVTMAPFKKVLSCSEIVTLHIPSVKDTYHLMGVAQFQMMKEGAYFINTARGMLVDTVALYQALQSGKLAGAAVDVYEVEPPKKECPLFQLDNIICTPHVASETIENNRAISLASAQAIIDVFEGRIPENLLNP